MIVVPWVLLMVGVATTVILCASKKGKCVHVSKPCIFHGEYNPHYALLIKLVISSKHGKRPVLVVTKV